MNLKNLKKIFTKNSSADRLLPEYAKLYLNHLLAKYRNLTSDNLRNNQKNEVLIKTFIDKEVADLTWGDLYLIEISVLSAFSPDDLRREANLIRNKYRDVAGLKAYEEYLKTGSPKLFDEDVPENLLRADLKSLLGQIYWLYASSRGLRRKHTLYIMLAAFIPTILLMIVFGSMIGSISFNYAFWDIPIFILVIIAGAMGGFISMQKRLQQAPTVGDPLITFSNLTDGKFSYFIGPITGSFLALVLYIIFAAGMIKGSVFPEIITVSQKEASDFYEKTLSFKNFTKGTGVNSGENYAKLLVWSFLAGFAERFVPDTLNWFVEKKGPTQIAKETS